MEEGGTVTRRHLTFSVSLPSCRAAIKAADMSPKGGRETNKERGKGCGLQAVSHGHLDRAAVADTFLLKHGSCRAAGARLKNASVQVKQTLVQTQRYLQD